MVPSDRFLTCLGEYLSGEVGFDLDPVLRDWSGTKGSRILVLDADEPVEHEGLDGVFEMRAVAEIRVKARDFDDNDRRELFGRLDESLTSMTGGLLDVVAWMNDSDNDRGIGVELLEVHDLRSDGGSWGFDEEWLVGKVEILCGFTGIGSDYSGGALRCLDLVENEW